MGIHWIDQGILKEEDSLKIYRNAQLVLEITNSGSVIIHTDDLILKPGRNITLEQGNIYLNSGSIVIDSGNTIIRSGILHVGTGKMQMGVGQILVGDGDAIIHKGVDTTIEPFEVSEPSA